MLMQQLDGVAASPFTPDAYSPHEKELGQQFWSIPVSYTHLTLPTNREV